jgi:alanine-glyoxylate transaminase/serine-glyoxylate transaminase/serine-pyruvate transaminase
LTLAGTLSGVEMGLQLAEIPLQSSGIQAAMDVLLSACRQQKPNLAHG